MRRPHRTRCVLLLSLAALTCAGDAGAPSAPAPAAGAIPASGPAAEAAARIQTVFDEVAAITADAALSPDAKRAQVEHRVAPLLDYATLTRAALGSNAERFSREEYGEFSNEYARFVTDILLQRFAAYPGQASHVESARYDAEHGLVFVEARGVAETSGHPALERLRQLEPIHLELALRERFGEWRIAGLKRGGVDVSRSFREQFASVLDRSDPAALIERLRARNRENEARNPFAPDA